MVRSKLSPISLARLPRSRFHQRGQFHRVIAAASNPSFSHNGSLTKTSPPAPYVAPSLASGIVNITVGNVARSSAAIVLNTASPFLDISSSSRQRPLPALPYQPRPTPHPCLYRRAMRPCAYVIPASRIQIVLRRRSSKTSPKKESLDPHTSSTPKCRALPQPIFHAVQSLTRLLFLITSRLRVVPMPSVVDRPCKAFRHAMWACARLYRPP